MGAPPVRRSGSPRRAATRAGRTSTSRSRARERSSSRSPASAARVERLGAPACDSTGPRTSATSRSARSRSAGRRDIPYDEAVRTGTFVRGRARRARPRRAAQLAWRGGDDQRHSGPTAASPPTVAVRGAELSQYGWTKQRLRLDLAQLGRWTLRYSLDGTVLAEAPFDVVATARQIGNRPPEAVTASLEPAAPRAGEVVVCRVATSLVTEDPDYDIVRYRYRWTSGGRRRPPGDERGALGRDSATTRRGRARRSRAR